MNLYQDHVFRIIFVILSRLKNFSLDSGKIRAGVRVGGGEWGCWWCHNNFSLLKLIQIWMGISNHELH